MTRNIPSQSGYALVNSLKMYYEVYGTGRPIVLIHGGGSTIQTSFGNLIPLLAQHRQVIGVEMQAHGRTGDRDAELSFAQDADDIAALLDHLQIEKADFLGFSNGGQTCIEIGIRHPQRINKLIIAAAFYKRSAVVDAFWEGMGQAAFSDMPQLFKDEFLKVNNDPEALQQMFNRDVKRMQDFKGWTDDDLKKITAKTLVISGDADVGSVEHTVEMFRYIPNCELAIIPGGHGKLIGEALALNNGAWTQKYVAQLIEEFLNK
jgi:pimeloyl-ACP methyl ester carboxylesterase